MKRDMDLCRRVLLAVEESPPGKSVSRFSFAGEYPDNTVPEHVVLLEEAGFLDAVITPTFDGVLFSINRLTWEGHDFLRVASDDGRWDSAKERAGAAWESISFGVLKTLLEELLKSSLSLG
jgi:hypothetical protein